MKKKAIIAMSGGVDSSVAAYLMQEAGYDVSGAIMKLFDTEPAGKESAGAESEAGAVADAKGKLRGTDNIEDARRVAERLGIELGVFDMRREFKDAVIERFVAAYESGQTPNPCVFCNKRLKFDELYDMAVKSIANNAVNANSCRSTERCAIDSDTDAENSVNDEVYGKRVSESESVEPVIATGHYAVIEYDEKDGRYKLRKSADPAKDQSYFLYTLSQEQLSRTAFPLGGLSKNEVREIAASQGFVTAKKKESQDICFIPGGDYAAFIKEYTGRDYPAGDFVDEDGNVMGEHKGIINYTIGQRKGLGLALKKPAYVLKLDTEANRVVLGDNEELFKRELTARDFNWLSMAPPSGPFRASARIRYRHREAPCEVIPLFETSSDAVKADAGSDNAICADNKKTACSDSDNKKDAECTGVRIIFDEPQRAITRGQSVVLYDGDYVLGGGIID